MIHPFSCYRVYKLGEKKLVDVFVEFETLFENGILLDVYKYQTKKRQGKNIFPLYTEKS